MASRFDVVTQQLFQKNIDDCSVEELQDLANDYPYFAPAQYILLTKLKETNHEAYQAQLQKAILYYHDPLMFDQFINEENHVFEFSSVEQETVVPNTGDADLKTELTQNELSDKLEEEITESNEEKPAINNGTIAEHRSEMQSKEIIVPEEEAEPVEIPEEEISVGSEEEPQSNIEVSGEENIQRQNKELVSEEKSEPEVQLHIQEATASPEALTFEPYHTVDYFASQGIKLSQEEATKDKFGKQLKSFTEWLKTMKKLPAPEQAKPLDVGAEQKVENLAAHSVEGEEVYTETMAEVWVRQGNRQKAAEIYNKLSLLNPSKRAYFAAKIDSLK